MAATWKNVISVDDANSIRFNTLAESLEIMITEVGDDYVKATMPVDKRTHQPMGILHGGASVALAETIGSFAAQMAAEPGYYCVGLDINANHTEECKGRIGYGGGNACAYRPFDPGMGDKYF